MRSWIMLILVWMACDGDTQLYTPCGTNLWRPWNANNGRC
jgi:hypothetical protein